MAEKIKLKKTGAGAHQYMRGIDNKDPDKFKKISRQVDKIRNVLEKDLDKLGTKGFKEKYGMSYTSANKKVSAIDNAETARIFKEKYGKKDITANIFDRLEKTNTKKSKGASDYRKGGLTLKTVDNRKKK